MDGPPFSVPPAEVERLYGARAGVRLLSRRPILDQEPRFVERGLTLLDECAFVVTLP
jgi:thiopurine S-methyltransferase